MNEILYTYLVEPLVEDPIMCGLVPFVLGCITGILSHKYNKYKKQKEDKENE